MSRSVHTQFAVSIMALLASSFCAAENSVKPVDLTPYFSNMEKDCSTSNKLNAELTAWLVPDEKGRMKSQKSAPQSIASVVGHTKVKNAGESWTVSAATAEAQYKGVSVKRIDRWSGKDNGISGFSLIFAEPLAVVGKKLHVAKAVKDSEQTMPQLLETKDESKTVATLVCDFSN